jgi:hypothetical protein
MSRFNVFVNGVLEYENIRSVQLEELVFSIVTQYYGQPVAITWNRVV